MSLSHLYIKLIAIPGSKDVGENYSEDAAKVSKVNDKNKKPQMRLFEF
jgi:hypothetical protein